jgi:hypothetical protein
MNMSRAFQVAFDPTTAPATKVIASATVAVGLDKTPPPHVPFTLFGVTAEQLQYYVILFAAVYGLMVIVIAGPRFVRSGIALATSIWLVLTGQERRSLTTKGEDDSPRRRRTDIER